MTSVSIRELRNHGGDVVDRVAAGETVVITRSGKPVADFDPLPFAVNAARAFARVASELRLVAVPHPDHQGRCVPEARAGRPRAI